MEEYLSNELEPFGLLDDESQFQWWNQREYVKVIPTKLYVKLQ